MLDAYKRVELAISSCWNGRLGGGGKTWFITKIVYLM